MSTFSLWWEPYLAKYAHFPGDIFIDVGANIGEWSKGLAKFYREVIAFEPDPRNLPGLEKDLPGNVRVIQAAAWKEFAILILHTFKSTMHTSVFKEDPDEHSGPSLGPISVPAISIDSLALRPKVDFIKVDVEGAEKEVLFGARNLLSRDHPVLLVEVHSGENGIWVKSFLNDLGYVVKMIRNPGYEPSSSCYSQHFYLRAEYPK